MNVGGAITEIPILTVRFRWRCKLVWWCFKSRTKASYVQVSDPLELNIRALEFEVIETSLYWCVSLTTLELQCNQTCAAQQWMLPRVIGCVQVSKQPHGVPYRDVLQVAGDENIETSACKRGMLWAGNVVGLYYKLKYGRVFFGTLNEKLSKERSGQVAEPNGLEKRMSTFVNRGLKAFRGTQATGKSTPTTWSVGTRQRRAGWNYSRVKDEGGGEAVANA